MNKKEIVYIKNDKEKKVRVNNFNIRSVSREVFSNDNYGNGRRFYYEIDDDVQYLYFKNITFYGSIYFKNLKNAMLILDNCTFEGEEITFKGGTAQIINPKFKYGDFYTKRISMYNGSDFSYVSDNDVNVSLRIDAEKVSINPNMCTIGDIIINNEYGLIKDISLDGIGKMLHSSSINGNRISIVNSDIETSESISMNSSNIIIDDKSTISSKNISFNGMVLSDDKNIVLNKNNFNGLFMKRLQLISVLKNLRKNLNDAIDKKIEPVEYNYDSLLDELKKKYEKDVELLKKRKSNHIKRLRRDYNNKRISDCKKF